MIHLAALLFAYAGFVAICLSMAKHQPEILGRKLTDRKIIHIMEDTGISRGGVLIETAFGDIDATIEAQVEHLRSTILPNE